MNTGAGSAFQTGLDVVQLSRDPAALREQSRRTRRAELRLSAWPAGGSRPGRWQLVANDRNGPRESSISLLPWPNEHRFGLYNLEMEYAFSAMKLVSSTSRTEKDRHNILDATGLLIGIPPTGMPDSLAVPFITDQDSTSFAQESPIITASSGRTPARSSATRTCCSRC